MIADKERHNEEAKESYEDYGIRTCRRTHFRDGNKQYYENRNNMHINLKNTISCLTVVIKSTISTQELTITSRHTVVIIGKSYEKESLRPNKIKKIFYTA